MLKEAGVLRIADRQIVCNALSKALREGKVALVDQEKTDVLDGLDCCTCAQAGADPALLQSDVEGFTVTTCLAPLPEVTSEARSALSRLRTSKPAVPDRANVVVVGAGVAGVHAAIELLKENPREDVVLLEKASSAGGIWMEHANSYSRVNSSEPAYRVFGRGRQINHTPAYQILSSMTQAMEAFGIAEMLFTSCDVRSVARWKGDDDGARGWHVTGRGPGEARLGVECNLVMLCTNRRLGKPRTLTFQGEGSFSGRIERGLRDDAAHDAWGRTLIVGMGAYALEHTRTALERGAPRATILCRQRGVVCPQVVDWVNFVRPVRRDFSKDPSGNTAIQLAWFKTYHRSGAKVPECWRERPRLLKPDGHTVSTSDLFFVAHHMQVADTLLGEVERVVSDGVVTQSYGDAPRATIRCETIVKCVGFHTNDSNAKILDQERFRGIGMVDQNLWFIAEPHLDAGTFSLPFGSSYLNQAQFMVKVAAKAFRSPDLTRTLSDLPCDASVSHFTASDIFRSIMSSDETVHRVLHEHVRQTTDRFHHTLPFSEYLDRNEAMWEEYHLLLHELHKTPVSPFLPWMFRAFGELVVSEWKECNADADHL